MRELMKPGARVIPSRGTIRVALAEDARDSDYRLGEVSGFDLSPFETLARPVRQFSVGHERLVTRGEPRDLFDFDFASSNYCPPAQSKVICRSSGGRVSGIVQWIALTLDEVTRYENRPGLGATSCWAALFYPFAKPIDTGPGDEICVYGAHDRHDLTIWTKP